MSDETNESSVNTIQGRLDKYFENSTVLTTSRQTKQQMSLVYYQGAMDTLSILGTKANELGMKPESFGPQLEIIQGLVKEVLDQKKAFTNTNGTPK